MSDIVRVDKTGRMFKVSWKMTSSCNYRCPYCYMRGEVEKGRRTPDGTVLSIASRIDGVVERQAKGRPVLLHLIGGEVSTYDLEEVVSRVETPLLRTVVVATNLSAPLSYWESLAAYLRHRRVALRIIASFHLTECDPAEFVEKAALLGATVKCVVSSRNIGGYRPHFASLRDRGVGVEVTVERDGENACENLSGADRELVEALQEEYKRGREPYFVVSMRDGSMHEFGTNIEFINSIDVGGFDPDGFVCTAGLDGVRIAQDGSLRRAGCRHAAISGVLGNILGEYALPTEPFVCRTGEADGKGIWKHKMCTCFGNASMWREED